MRHGELAYCVVVLPTPLPAALAAPVGQCRPATLAHLMRRCMREVMLRASGFYLQRSAAFRSVVA